MKNLKLLFEQFLKFKYLFFGFVITSILLSLSKAGVLWLIKDFLEKAISANSNNFKNLYLAAGLIFFLWVLSAFFEYGSKVYQQSLMRSIEQNTLMRVVRHFFKLSVRFFDRSSHGDLLVTSRVDINAMRDLVSSYATILVSFLTILSLLIVAFKISFSLTFWGLIVLPISFGPIIYLGNRIRIAAERKRKISYKIFDLLVQLFNGIRLIKVNKAEKEEEKNIDFLSKNYYKEFLKTANLKALSGMVLEAVTGFGVVFVVVLGGIMVFKGKIDWPSLLGIIMIMLSLKEPAKNIVHSNATLRELLPSMERLEKLFKTKSEIEEKKNSINLKEPLKTLSFENVSFSYDHKKILRNISFSVKKGETIGIVGPSGVGKTTLLSLIPRFFDPTEGKLVINGIDLRDLNLSDLIEKIGIVTQTPFLFNSTIYENVLYGKRDAKEEEVINACKLAYIHDEIIELPDGYNTFVGIGGVNLSLGQKQRINIARAILKKPEILLLDEATSSLDSISEAKVQKAIENLMEGKTSFIIAHRISTLRNADKILVLNNGYLEDFGSHEELLQRNLTYKVLWETQSKFYFEESSEDQFNMMREYEEL